MYPDDPAKQAYARKIMQRKARDNSRTPVQWSSEPHAGFTSPSSKPWMRVNSDYEHINVAAELSKSDSVYAFWKECLARRKEHKAVFVYGDFELVDAEHDKVVAYKRWSGDRAVLVVLNFSGETVKWTGLGELTIKGWWTGNYKDGLEKIAQDGAFVLRPWEGVVGELN